MSAAFRAADRRAREQMNRRGNRMETRSIWAAVAMQEVDESFETGWLIRMGRWILAFLLLPVCWVTAWTFLNHFADVALDRTFWQSTQFWYFAIGCLVMAGWFVSGLLQRFFLYLYVFGHELTHAACVLLFRGRVTDFHVSADGGYITTTKTNVVIALSPYFVPFWSIIVAAVYAVVILTSEASPLLDQVFYGLMGLTWTFHMVWTLWMLPRDQPDLKQNGVLLSLVLIFLANLLVLVGLLCIASETPLARLESFGREWLRWSATWAHTLWRHASVAADSWRALLNP